MYKEEDLRNIYEFSNRIGTGKAKIYKVKHKQTGQIRAIKQMQLDQTIVDTKSRIIAEVEILKNLTHPGIVNIYEYYISKDNIYIVQELVKGGDLFDKLIQMKYFNEKMAAFLMK